jgi:hypothetical protein
MPVDGRGRTEVWRTLVESPPEGSPMDIGQMNKRQMHQPRCCRTFMNVTTIADGDVSATILQMSHYRALVSSAALQLVVL